MTKSATTDSSKTELYKCLVNINYIEFERMKFDEFFEWISNYLEFSQKADQEHTQRERERRFSDFFYAQTPSSNDSSYIWLKR